MKIKMLKPKIWKIVFFGILAFLGFSGFVISWFITSIPGMALTSVICAGSCFKVIDIVVEKYYKSWQ
jgi:hypothetical protein